MSFDWVEYVKLAENFQKKLDESYLRSSISRAYYGIFCIVRNIKGYKDYTKADIHGKVINEYKNSDNLTEKNIGRILDELRRNRNDADYNEDKSIGKDLTERVVLKAKEILRCLGISL
jgi:uncharacterized protein (UPF0332 family)